MATIKSYTDEQQSKKLAKILPLESADMYHFINEIDKVYKVGFGYRKITANYYSKTKLEYIPCWSLAALLSILPNNEHITTSVSRGSWEIDPVEYLPNTWWCEYEDSKSLTEFNVSADNPVDACVAMIEKLNELKML